MYVLPRAAIAGGGEEEKEGKAEDGNQKKGAR